MVLKMTGCDVFYDKVQALQGISIEVHDREIISIIGANGAGKSTLMKCILNIAPPRGGRVEFFGESLENVPTHNVVKRGISYIPEGREIFPNMTVLENLEMGAYSLKETRKRTRDRIEEMYEMFPRLSERKSQKAGSMSGGEQQMLAVARGLMLCPKLLMCDEPSLGLAPKIVDEIFDTIVRVNRTAKIPVLLVEQNAFMALSVSNRCYVLENGHIVTSGASGLLMESDDIKKAYLGK